MWAFFDERLCFEIEKRSAASPPRRCHRDFSTQKAGSGIRPDRAGTMKSTPIVRSCRPPFTMSPAWMKTSMSPVFSMSSSFTEPVSWSTASDASIDSSSTRYSGIEKLSGCGSHGARRNQAVRFCTVTGGLSIGAKGGVIGMVPGMTVLK